MTVILVISAVLLSVWAADIRVKSAEKDFNNTSDMLKLTQMIEKNYAEKMESVLYVCSDFFGCEIHDKEMLLNKSNEYFGRSGEQFSTLLCSLTEANKENIAEIVANIKEKAADAEKKSAVGLDTLKKSVYIFYPGITFIFALLIL